MTKEKKKVAKKARLAPDLRQKKLQVGKRSNAGNATQSKAIFERSGEACEEGFRISFT